MWLLSPFRIVVVRMIILQASETSFYVPKVSSPLTIGLVAHNFECTGKAQYHCYHG